MSLFFSNSNLLKKFNTANIDSWIQQPLEKLTCDKYNIFLKPNEIRNMEKELLNLIRYLLTNNKFEIPCQTINPPFIYRAGRIETVDGKFFPVSKSVASNCPTPGTINEPIWFSLTPLHGYLGLTPNNRYGLVACRRIKDISTDKKINFLINLSTNIEPTCNTTPPRSYLLSKSLQTAINKVILVLIVRLYCNTYSELHPEDLTYEFIIANAGTINLSRTVNGYDCDDRYRGGTIATLLESWNYADGTRSSIYNEDRIEIDVLFEIFNLIERIINNFTNIIKKDVVNIMNRHMQDPSLQIDYDVKINLLGWICKNVPQKTTCRTFPGEWALSIKNFSKPMRYNIFDPRDINCQIKFYIYDNTTQRNYREINMNELPSQTQTSSGFLEWIGFGGFGQTESVEFEPETTMEYSKKPEDINSDLFEVFFDTKSDESLYTKQPEGLSEIIKNYIDKNKLKYSKNVNISYNDTTNPLKKYELIQFNTSNNIPSIENYTQTVAAAGGSRKKYFFKKKTNNRNKKLIYTEKSKKKYKYKKI